MAEIPSNSTGNSAGQHAQEQVSRQGTTNIIPGRYTNETPHEHEWQLETNREQARRRRQEQTSEQREHLLAQRRQEWY